MKRLPILIVRAVGIGLLMGAATCTCTATYNYYDYCDPGIPSSECYRDRRDPDSEQVATATSIALRYIDEHPVEDELWDWKSGVLMYALTELHRVTGDDRLESYFRSWLDYHIDQGYELVWSDSVPPAITAVALLSETPDDRYQQVVDDTLEYLDEVAPRTEEGGISHNGIAGGESMWIDSLFMFGMFLNRWGELADETRLDMFSDQIEIFASVLQDDNGLMRHAQDWPGYDESLYWARGNAWVVASLSDYLRIRVERDETDEEIEQIFRDHVAAILGQQDGESGLWWTLLNRPGEIYLETSASALFAYGIARAYRYGVLEDDERTAAQRVIEGIRDMIREEANGPVVTGVSFATDPWSYEEYAAVPLRENLNYGVGAVILALLETSGLPE